METENSLFIKVLVWAYNRKQNVFTTSELFKELNLNPTEKDWVMNTFVYAPQNSYPLFSVFKPQNENGYLLSDRGMSIVLNYLGLKETRESSKQAMKIATWSLYIAIVVGIAGIFCQILIK